MTVSQDSPVPSSIPSHEQHRLRTLKQYDLLESPPTDALDRVTRLAMHLFDVSSAMVSVLDQTHQQCIATQGIALEQTSREISFCERTIEQDGVMVVDDALEDDRFSDNPLVIGEPYIRFYAGAPLTAPNGYRLGTLCLVDDTPHSFSDEDRKLLSDLAGVVMDELNLRHYASDLDASRQVYREISNQQRRILESITDAFVAVDENWTFAYVNSQAEVFLQESRDALLGRNLWDAFPEAVGSPFEEKYKTAMEEGTTVEFVEYYPPLDRWFEVKAFPYEGGLSIYFDDVTDRLQAEEGLRRERALVEAIMDTSVTALVIVDGDGSISFANDPASDILGLDGSELAGAQYHDTGTLRQLDGTVVPVEEWPFQHIMERGSAVEERRFVFERHDGTERYISVNGAPLREPDGSVKQVVFSIDDITEQVQYENELKAAKEEAEHASQIKSAFLANVSHDVQTPLSSILNHADLLRMELGEEYQERVQFIKRSGKRLLDTFESVLDLSKLEAGAVEPSLEQLDLADELLGTIEIFQPQANAEGITLEADVEEPLPAKLDPTMVHRITDNLLSNALKFTESGGRVTLRAANVNGQIKMEVKDTGVGIDDAFLPELFEAFTRGPEQNKTDGSGLGLAIAKQLTHLMDGTIEVESERGKGTTFTVRLPRN